ncbi:MAG: transporter substrate-binding domain-containing protein [Campylobacterota bacterium]|nr:transporter substrate-binding domain-containing protein [Campylobacterota bacterium]
MVTKDAEKTVSLRAMVNKEGIYEKDLTKLKHSFNIDDLINNKTDLMVSYISNEPFYLNKKGIEYTIFDPKNYGFDFYSDILFTSEEEVQNNPKRVNLFTKASLKGWEYAFNNIEESVDLILKKYNSQNKSRNALLYEAYQLKKLAYFNNEKLGNINKFKIQRIYDIYNVMGFIKNHNSVDDLLLDNNENTFEIKLTKDDISYLKNKKVITMCVDPNWMPLEKIENGEHIGLVSDYMKIISSKIDTPIELLVTSSWEESVLKVKNAECDILSMVSKTIDMERFLDFPSPYITISTIIATKPTQIYINNLESHLDKTWAVVKGYALATRLKNDYPNIKLLYVNSFMDGLQKVEEGKVFGYIDNSIVVRDAIQKHFLGTISITGRVDLNREYTVGIRDDDKMLYNIFNKAILSIDLKTKQQILNSWVTLNQSVKKDYTLVWQILIVVFIIFIFMIYRHKILNNNNNKLEKSIQKATKNLKKRNQTLVKQQMELEESVKNFKNLFDTTMEMIVMFKPNGEIIEINQPGVILGGFENKSELIGKNISEFILKSEMPKVKKAMKNDTLEPYELTMVNKYGEKVYTLISGRNIIRDGKPIRISSIVNLTEIKQKDKYIQQQSKLALMGEMISMIAHQWRQPLNIIGAINMKIETKLDFDEKLTSENYALISADINKQLSFMSKTIDDFRDFFKPNKEKEETTFTKLVNSSLGMVASSIKSKHIKIIKELDCDDKFVTYSNEVTQVILNIIKNAEDILVDRDIKKPYIKLVSYKKDDKYILEIIDNGGGIPEKIIDKIFDPYFSTKLEKNGTGLGLYMSRTIIEEHCGGELTVKNKDKGVVFRISL